MKVSLFSVHKNNKNKTKRKKEKKKKTARESNLRLTFLSRFSVTKTGYPSSILYGPQSQVMVCPHDGREEIPYYRILLREFFYRLKFMVCVYIFDFCLSPYEFFIFLYGLLCLE